MKSNRINLLLILILIVAFAQACGGGGNPLTGDSSESPDLATVINLTTQGVNFDGISSTTSGTIITVQPGTSHLVGISPPEKYLEFDFTVKCSDGMWLTESGDSETAFTTSERIFEWLAPDSECQVQLLFTPHGAESELQLGLMIAVSTSSGIAPPAPAPVDRIATFTDPSTGFTSEIAAGELLVKIDRNSPITSIMSLRSGQDYTLVERVSERDPLFRLKFNDSVDLELVIEEISADYRVEIVEPNYIAYITAEPTDPDYGKKHEFPKIDATLAWDLETGNPDVWVAVIDTGVDKDHPDLVNNVVPGADFITGGEGDGSETEGDGVDNNQDGMVDQNVGHGTHVAGIIAGMQNNGEGACGIAPDVTILPLRIFPTNGDTGATFSSIISAIEYATTIDKVKVISMSIGTTYESSLLQSAINEAWGAGKVIVAAACNSNTSAYHYPAAHNNVYSVAAISKSGTKASFSNYGSWVDISAYGTGIYSTLFDDTYAYMSGTSMACPLVSGCMALLFSHDPDLTNDQAVDVLSMFIDDVYELNPDFTGQLGSGLVNPFEALVGLDHSQPGEVDDADGGGEESGTGFELGPNTDI